MAVHVVAENVEPLHTEAAPLHPDLLAALKRFDEAQHQQEERVVVRRALPDREILGAMVGLGALLSVRLMLAMSVAGAFWLAREALTAPTIMGLWVLVVYAAATVAPLSWLSTKRV